MNNIKVNLIVIFSCLNLIMIPVSLFYGHDFLAIMHCLVGLGLIIQFKGV